MLSKFPRRRVWQPTPVFLPRKSMDRGAWRTIVLGIVKSRARLSDWATERKSKVKVSSASNSPTFTRASLLPLTSCFLLILLRISLLHFKNIWFYLFSFHSAGFSLLHGLSLVAVSRARSRVVAYRLLIAVVSLVAEHRLYGKRGSIVAARGLSSCGSQAVEHRLRSFGPRA